MAGTIDIHVLTPLLLMADIGAVDDVLELNSVDGLDATGIVLIAGEAIAYGSINSPNNELEGLTRGVLNPTTGQAGPREAHKGRSEVLADLTLTPSSRAVKSGELKFVATFKQVSGSELVRADWLLDGNLIKQVEDFTLLGSLITFDGPAITITDTDLHQVEVRLFKRDFMVTVEPGGKPVAGSPPTSQTLDFKLAPGPTVLALPDGTENGHPLTSDFVPATPTASIVGTKVDVVWSRLFIPYSVDPSGDTIADFFTTTGAGTSLYTAKDDEPATVDDVFILTAATDLSGGELATAKGSAVAIDDVFKVTNVSGGSEAVEYVALGKKAPSKAFLLVDARSPLVPIRNIEVDWGDSNIDNFDVGGISFIDRLEHEYESNGPHSVLVKLFDFSGGNIWIQPVTITGITLSEKYNVDQILIEKRIGTDDEMRPWNARFLRTWYPVTGAPTEETVSDFDVDQTNRTYQYRVQFRTFSTQGQVETQVVEVTSALSEFSAPVP